MPPVTLKLFFCLIVMVKCQFLNDGCQLWPHISKLFQNQFSKFLCLSWSKFPGLLKKGQKFLCMCSRTRENDKKQSGSNIVGNLVWGVPPEENKVCFQFSFMFQNSTMKIHDEGRQVQSSIKRFYREVNKFTKSMHNIEIYRLQCQCQSIHVNCKK